uniref:Uncharacterized protein n=1 Tax=Arundo donax TaxID=35708 RepID=A0A0A9SN02_ARUDO
MVCIEIYGETCFCFLCTTQCVLHTY